MHNHATNVLAMTHVGPTDEKEFTLALWRIIPEAIVLFPEGIGLVPFMVCGTQDIADATLEKMRIVVSSSGSITASSALVILCTMPLACSRRSTRLLASISR